MRRLVIRFKDGSTTSLDLVPGREREDLLRLLRHFPRKEVGSVEEQVYDPEHPRRFRYVRREDLEGLLLKCPRFGFATWGAKVRAVEGLFWGPHRGFRRGGVLSYKGEDLGEGM
jgi:hypothetical protein